jgi:Protein of unknown function (DUF3105)
MQLVLGFQMHQQKIQHRIKVKVLKMTEWWEFPTKTVMMDRWHKYLNKKISKLTLFFHQTNLATDFDPQSFEHSMFYSCLESTYNPNRDVEPVETNHAVNKFYTPVHLCMNITIKYDQRIPALGYHRPLWAAYGEYTYLPPQRWLHNLEHGAIVFLYHPCANKNLVEKLKRLVKSCLYRYLITPYRNLTAERPFALVGWATSLEFGVIDQQTFTDFIKKYAKSGPEKTSRNGQYKEFLIEPAKFVSDADDSEICLKM